MYSFMCGRPSFKYNFKRKVMKIIISFYKEIKATIELIITILNSDSIVDDLLEA